MDDARDALDILRIQQTLACYARAVDRCDWELLRSCYTDDATDEHGRYNGGIDGFVAWLMVELPRYESTMHTIANSVIHVDRPTAAAETYCVAFHRSGPDERSPQFDRTVGLRYVDELRLVDGMWRISHRRCVYEWCRVDAVPPGSALADAYVRGRRDPLDPSSAVLTRVGAR